MVPRGKLDISFAALFKGIVYCGAELLGATHSKEIKTVPNTLYCLSVRTGLDLTLQALNFEPGSEVLVTNINIPDMFSILSAHRLVCVPLSVNKHTLEISAQQIKKLINPSTKAILITHLFGAVINIQDIINLAKEHHLMVLEDCAQAFNGVYKGNPGTDVVMYSFGLIKTNTSLTGAMLRFNNPELQHKVTLLQNQLPIQYTGQYLKKLFKALIIKMITQKWSFTLLYWLSQKAGKNFDDVLAGFTKGFPGADVMGKIRYRPCQANLRLMGQRIATFPLTRISKRQELALSTLRHLPEVMKIGQLNDQHTYWVLAIESTDPGQLIKALRARGYDATQKASSLVKIKGTKEVSYPDELDLDKLVYLPAGSGILQIP
jgi:dTDP-4-amino-4,6-dideoxygalactose transaminase